MSDRGLHRVADDLRDAWVEEWAGNGIDDIESYLSKHAAFLAFLDDTAQDTV